MSRTKRKNKNGIYIVVVVACALLIIGLMTFAWLQRNPRDFTSGCSMDSSKTANTFAFLVDATDPFSDLQAAKIRSLIESLISSIKEEARFQIYIMSESQTEVLEPAFDQCSYASSFSDPPALERFRRINFERNIFSELNSGENGVRSPIIHSISSVAVNMPKDRSLKSLIIVSDLYEHSDIFSHYAMPIKIAMSSRSDEIVSTMPDLRGVHIHLQVIDRIGLNQDGAFIDGWLEYFNRTGARMVSMNYGDENDPVRLEIAERVTR